MNTAFKKAACMTDIHFGKSNNSVIHNEDCSEFIDWFCIQAKKQKAETCIFLGDWHEHRNTINVSTLNYTFKNLQKLSNNFEKLYFIIGNHDIYYRDRRDIHSLPMILKFNNIIPILEPKIIDQVSFVPWLVNDEWQGIPHMNSKYMFGHFELPGFFLNSMIKMPETNKLDKFQFKKQDYIFSGHFHKRQKWKNVHYIGNPFGHDYADSWDFNRGAMFLSWGGKPEYINWEDGPKYLTTQLSTITKDPKGYLKDKSYIKATIDVKLSYEDMLFLKTLFKNNFSYRELSLVSDGIDQFSVGQSKHEDISLKTIDDIVVDELKNITSKVYKVDYLTNIYNSL